MGQCSNKQDNMHITKTLKTMQLNVIQLSLGLLFVPMLPLLCQNTVSSVRKSQGIILSGSHFDTLFTNTKDFTTNNLMKH